MSVDPAHEQTLRTLAANMGNPDKLKEICAEGFWFSPPGAPQMPVEEFAGMMGAFKAAFPDWESVMGKIEYKGETEDGTVGALGTHRHIADDLAIGCLTISYFELLVAGPHIDQPGKFICAGGGAAWLILRRGLCFHPARGMFCRHHECFAGGRLFSL